MPNVVTRGEQGLLAVELHPDYPSDRRVYAFATVRVGDAVRSRLLVMRNSGGVARRAEVLVDIPAAAHHNGARMLFGPDRKLWLVIGDRLLPRLAQNLNVPSGKVLRMNARGSVPADNPRPNSRVYAYGIRNSYGFDFDPATGRLWETENGPECTDELNLIRPLRNYGWGRGRDCASSDLDVPFNTNQDGPNPTLPVAWFDPPVAPTGLAFCRSCDLGPATKGRMFFGQFKTGNIVKARLDRARTSIANMVTAFRHDSFVLSLERGSNGTIFFSDGTAIYRLALQ